jgi:hypothetical protein
MPRRLDKVYDRDVGDEGLQKPEAAQPINTERFIMFSVITNIYNQKTKGPTLMEFFTATGKLKKFFFYN